MVIVMYVLYKRYFLATTVMIIINACAIGYCIAQKFDRENFDELIMGFKGETLRDKRL